MDTRQQKNPVSSSDEWYTPKWMIDKLGPFDLDPCSPVERPFDTATVHVNLHQGGLKYDWGQARVWLNPPYSKVLFNLFVRRMCEHRNGIALLINRLDNVLWQEHIFSTASSMLLLRHRVRFLNPDGNSRSPMFGSVLVAWGEDNDRILRECNIEGKYLRINEGCLNPKEQIKNE